MKKNLVITYNRVSGYPSGNHQTARGKVLVLDGEGANWSDSRKERLENVLREMSTLSPIDFSKVYMYLGSVTGDLCELKKFADVGVNLELVACHCDWQTKSKIAEELGASLVLSECDGRRTLWEIVETILYGSKYIESLKQECMKKYGWY